MSGILGIIHTDDSPVAHDTLSRMDAALAPWGADGGGLHVSHHLGLGSRLRHVTSEDQFEAQPASKGPVTLVASARLDNHAELCRTLVDTPADITPESALILAAYLRWGEDCVEHLRGDWAFALWDAELRRLLVARDATGNTSMYWWHASNKLIFASSLKAVLAHPDVPQRPDALQIASMLTVFHDAANEDATGYEGIRRLAPGHLLNVDTHGVNKRRWWQPERLPPLALRTTQDYDEAFVALYKDAVTQRLRRRQGDVALLLSAGLDSGSVAALAAPALHEQGQALQGYVHYPIATNITSQWARLVNEVPHARLTAQHIGHINVHAHDSAGTSVLQGILAGLSIHDQPAHAASNQFWMLDLLGKARANGAQIMLTGQGGNATVSYNGDGNLIPILKAGEISMVLQAILQEQSGPWQAFKQRLLKPLLRPAIASIRQHQRTRGAEPWEGHSPIRLDFARSLQLRQRMDEAGFDPSFTDPGRLADVARAFRLGTRKAGTLGALWQEMGEAFGLAVRDPTRDQSIVEFCWRVPDHVYWGTGEQRALIRRAMKGCLPTEVMYPAKKGIQAADISTRLQAIDAEIRGVLTELARHELANSWLNLPRMTEALDELGSPLSVTSARRNTGILARGLSVGLFLTRF